MRGILINSFSLFFFEVNGLSWIFSPHSDMSCHYCKASCTQSQVWRCGELSGGEEKEGGK